MINEILILLLFTLAIGIGWWLGRRGGKEKVFPSFDAPGYFIRGLDFIIKDQPADTVDAFLRKLAVNSETIDTHMSLGRYFRSRGEVDKATLVHQNLLAKPALNREKSLEVQLELARDYTAAGLFDRAERLLNELAGESGDIGWSSAELLMGIYEREKEWGQALEVAQQIPAFKSKGLRTRMAHYCCELAEIKNRSGEYALTRKHLKQAVQYDSSSVRAQLSLGELELELGNYKEAIKALTRIKDQDPDFLPLALPYLNRAYSLAGKEKDYAVFLEQVMQKRAMLSAVTELAQLKFGSVHESEGRQYVSEYLTKRPSIKALGYLHQWSANDQVIGDDGEELENNQIAREAMQRLLEELESHNTQYVCSKCGYRSKWMAWLCPSCRRWGKIKPVFGLEGE